MDPERAHHLALRGLRLGLAGHCDAADDPALTTHALGLTFKNPIGLAAGFDKDAVALRGLSRLGFGFLEAGTVTPRPQPGNPKPRMFRLTGDEAVINRLGFNNGGLPGYVGRLAERARDGIPVGANVGINKDSTQPERDYPMLVAAVSPFADYVVINVSSPNTPGLRDLQHEARLREILQAIAAFVSNHPPLLVKIAPDLSDASLQAIVETCVDEGVAGLIVSNTTLSRPGSLTARHAAQAGGLSGAPLLGLSTAVLARAALMARGRLTLIGCGGIRTGDDVLDKLRAGASLVQLYTAFAYQGPALIPRLRLQLAEALRQGGFAHPGEAVGVAAERIAGAV